MRCRRIIAPLIGMLALALPQPGAAAVSVRDDSGQAVALVRPAQRVVALAPHAAEMLFAAGGGASVVGVVRYSDFPAGAKALPQVGDYTQIDIERVVALKPDLLVVWASGNNARQLAQLRQLGIPMFFSEPTRLDDIATTVLRLGRLVGTDAAAEAVAARFRRQIAALAARYAKAGTVRVFYQVWDKPLYTVNGRQIVSDAIRLCGGENVFAHETAKAPQVGVESVLNANPEAIIVGRPYDAADTGLGIWKPFPALLAVQRNNLFTVNDQLLVRPGPRMSEGTAELCEKLALARQRRQ